MLRNQIYHSFILLRSSAKAAEVATQDGLGHGLIPPALVGWNGFHICALIKQKATISTCGDQPATSWVFPFSNNNSFNFNRDLYKCTLTNSALLALEGVLGGCWDSVLKTIMLTISCIKSEKKCEPLNLTLKYFSCKHCEELSLFQEKKTKIMPHNKGHCLRTQGWFDRLQNRRSSPTKTIIIVY